MKYLLTITTLYLLLSMSQAWSLPPCEGDESKWNNCEGILIYGEGTSYIGVFKDGIFDGKNDVNNIKYVGEYKDGKMDGQGIVTFPDGGKYVGEFIGGKYHGQGTYSFSTGEVWQGQWKNNFWTTGKKFSVKEYKEFLAGNKEVGKDFSLNNKELLDRKVLLDNEELPTSLLPESKDLPICEGSPAKWSEHVPTWNNCIGSRYSNRLGSKYDGEWKNGNPHGFGISILSNGDKYIGYFKNGHMHGKGKLSKNNGAYYLGEFKNGKKDGKGEEYKADGRILEGTFKDDEFVYAKIYKKEKVEDYSIYPGMPNNDKPKTESFHGGPATCEGSPASSKSVTKYWTACYGVEFSMGKVYDGFFQGGIFQSGTTYYGKRDWEKVELNKKKEVEKRRSNKKEIERTKPNKKNNTITKKKYIDPNEIINAASGSGFIVSSSGHIVTNNHVINGCNEVKVHYNGEQYKASILAKDDHNDLALIKANLTPTSIFTIKTGNAELMEDIYVAGYPFGDLFNSSVKITKGIVSSLSGLGNNFSNMQIDAALQPGNSGGPVIDYQGNVVGVAVAKLDLSIMIDLFKSVPENTNFAIKSSVLLNFLNSNGIKTKKASEQIIPRSELSEKITKGTLFLSCWMTYARIEEMKSQKVLFNNIIK